MQDTFPEAFHLLMLHLSMPMEAETQCCNLQSFTAPCALLMSSGPVRFRKQYTAEESPSTELVHSGSAMMHAVRMHYMLPQ